MCRSTKDLSHPGGMLACYFHQWQHWVSPEPGTCLGRGEWRPMTFHLKAIWRPHLETWPFRYLSVLISWGIWTIYSGFSKSSKSRRSYVLIKTPCRSRRVYSTTTGYKTCPWTCQREFHHQLWFKAKNNEEDRLTRGEKTTKWCLGPWTGENKPKLY